MNNRINSLQLISGDVWVGHDGGISHIIDEKAESFALNETLSTIGVSRIIDFNGRLVVALNGGGLFELKDKNFIELGNLSEDETYIRDLHVWKGKLYIATRGGLLCTKDLKTFNRVLREYPVSLSGIDDDGEQLYISSFSYGLLVYDHTKDVAEHLTIISEDYKINNLLIDSKKVIWLSSQMGVIKFDKGKTQLIDVNKGLPINLVTSFYEDRDNNLWIGSQGKGLIRAPKGDLCYFNRNSGLESELIVSGMQASDGSYYFGTFDAGLVHMTKDLEAMPKSLDYSTTVWAMVEGVGNANWYGTKTALFGQFYNGKLSEYSREDGSPGDKITVLKKISSSEMYVGGKSGIVKWRKGVFYPIGSNSKEIGTVRAIEKIDNSLFVATDLGLFQLKNGAFEIVKGFQKTVFCLAKDGKNRLWFGTEEGLFCYTNGILEKLNFSTEFASNTINFLNYKDNTLFVGTNNGLFMFTGEDILVKRKAIHVGLNEGLVDLETNLNSSFFDNNGSFWFGTSSGLVRFNPNAFQSIAYSVSLKVNSILLNYEPFSYEMYSSSINDEGLPVGLELPYNKNNITFNFEGISLDQYENIGFQYWLEGIETGWSPIVKSSSTTFSSLPSGDYIMHIRILDMYGYIRGEKHFSFTIKQAYYKSWWFLSLVLIGILSLLIVGFNYRIKREREKNEKERIEYKSKLMSLEQQSLNASMNRHFIFNALNSIQYFINTSDKLSANKYLTSFARLIRKNLDSSNVQDSMVSLAEELERIELYLSLESMRFKDKFKYKIINEGVDTESIQIPAMLIQPFVENAIIHGILPNEDKEGEIIIKTSEKDDVLCIMIKDNGIGIDNSLSKKSHFAGDHQSQGMEITFKRIDLIRKVSGQQLTIVGPNQINENDHSISGTVVLLNVRLENLENQS